MIDADECVHCDRRQTCESVELLRAHSRLDAGKRPQTYVWVLGATNISFLLVLNMVLLLQESNVLH